MTLLENFVKLFLKHCQLKLKSAHLLVDLKLKSAHLTFGCFELFIEGVESGEILAQPLGWSGAARRAKSRNSRLPAADR